MGFTFGSFSFSISFWMLAGILLIIAIIKGSKKKRKALARQEKDTKELKPMDIADIDDIDEGTVIPTLRVVGPIMSGQIAGLPSSAVTFGDVFAHRLAQLEKSKTVKAVIVYVNTPGGSPAGSEAIRDAIARCTLKKPVYVHVGDVSASGGMWAMVGAQKGRIFAGVSSLLGSIGVIGPTVHKYTGVTKVSGLLGNGVEAELIEGTVYSAGRGKAFGNPYTERDPVAEKWFEKTLQDTREAFIDIVHKGRGVAKTLFSDDNLGASVFSAKVALEHDLIDGIKSRSELEAHIADELKVPLEQCKFPVVARVKFSRLKALIGARAGFIQPDVQATLRSELSRQPMLVMTDRECQHYGY